MIKYLFILLFPFTLSAQMTDDTKHRIAGNLISYGTSEIVFQVTKKQGLAVVTGFVTGVTAGLVKEYIYDKNYGGTVDKWDAVSTGFGSALGTIIFVVRLDFYNINQRNKNKFKTFE